MEINKIKREIMRRLFSLIIVLSFMQMAFGQTIVSDIIKTDSTFKKSTLFSNGLTWFAYQFKSSNDVIQMKDLESGKIIGKGIFEYINLNGELIPRHVVITLTAKDGRYKYEIELESVQKFQIVMEASCFNCGKTTADVIYTNGNLQITNIVGGRGFYHYNDEIVKGLEKGNYKKWKAAVDAELPELRKKIENDIKTQEINQREVDIQKINTLVESLKSEMAKKGSDF